MKEKSRNAWVCFVCLVQMSFFATQSGMAQEMDEGIEWNANSGDMLHRVHKNDIHLTFHINVYVFIGAFNVYV